MGTWKGQGRKGGSLELSDSAGKPMGHSYELGEGRAALPELGLGEMGFDSHMVTQHPEHSPPFPIKCHGPARWDSPHSADWLWKQTTSRICGSSYRAEPKHWHGVGGSIQTPFPGSTLALTPRQQDLVSLCACGVCVCMRVRTCARVCTCVVCLSDCW